MSWGRLFREIWIASFSKKMYDKDSVILEGNKMKKFMEKVSILSLSLVLTTAFSISSALPAMLDFYKAYPPSQVELLISLPSFGIMAMLVLNSLLERFLTERQLIVIGLTVLSLCSFAPLISQAYGFIFVSRLVFGLGVGMINAKAISAVWAIICQPGLVPRLGKAVLVRKSCKYQKNGVFFVIQPFQLVLLWYSSI